MQIFRLADALNRRDFVALVHRGEAKTGIHATTVDMRSTGAALSVVATFFGPGQMQMLAKTVEKGSAGIDLEIVLLAVDMKSYGNRVHFSTLCRDSAPSKCLKSSVPS